MNVPDSILERIQKLMALQKNPGTPAEAENAAARIQEMLLKYNLSMAEIENHKVDDNDVIQTKGKFNVYQKYGDGDVAVILLRTVAEFNFCRSIRMVNGKKSQEVDEYVLIGKKYNVEVTLYMFEYVLNNLKILFQNHWKNYVKNTPAEYREGSGVHKRSYYQGALAAIRSRLEKQREAAIVESEKESGKYDANNPVNALIKVNKDAVDKRVKELFQNRLKSSPNRIYSSSDGRSAGYEAGSKLNLSKGLDNNNAGRPELKPKQLLLN